MNNSQFRVEGFDELEKVLKLLPKALSDKALDSAFRAGASVVAKDAKQRVPVRTGKLRDSITVRKAPAKLRAETGARIIIGFKKPESRRAHLTEFGTKSAAAKPFIRPALDTQAAAAIDKIGKKLKANIEKTAERLAGPFVKSGLAKSKRR